MPEFNLTKIEEKIQKFWEANNVLEKSLESRKGKKKLKNTGLPSLTKKRKSRFGATKLNGRNFPEELDSGLILKILISLMPMITLKHFGIL